MLRDTVQVAPDTDLATVLQHLQTDPQRRCSSSKKARSAA